MMAPCRLPALAAALFLLAGLSVTGAIAGGVEEDQEVVQQLGDACDGGEAAACHRLGTMYDFAQGVDEDLVLAAAYYRHACDGGHAAGCYGLAVKLQLGEGVARDPVQADALIRKACDGGLAIACDSLPPAAKVGND
ncbi:tetratricopeptide repeat protein [Pelagibius sp.]|uniref:tetratricopeptide repeat protein n=1 Tax=Pelagibius sp. TaxID=1931238 RepID=UPI00262512DB|nr:tetratricopeptide repeat protein [Pelagibius sp.]